VCHTLNIRKGNTRFSADSVNEDNQFP